MKFESNNVDTLQLSSSIDSRYFDNSLILQSEVSQDLIDDFESLEEKLAWNKFSKNTE